MFEVPGKHLLADELAALCFRYSRGARRYSIRELEIRDRAKVEEISGLTYGGHDYVAKVFTDWLERQGQDVFTATIESSAGTLAGFEVLTLYDAGRTGWLEALRVHPHFRGRGLATALQSHLITVARGLRLSRVRYTTAAANIPSKRLASACGLQVVASWGVIMPRRRSPIGAFAERVRATRGRFSRRRGYLPGVCQVHQCQTAPMELIQYSRRFKLRFLLQSYWKAYDFTYDNLEKLARTHEEPFVSKQTCGDAPAMVSSFSWAFQQHDALGLTVFATVYAADVEGTLAHLQAQLEAAVRAGADSAVFMYNRDLEPDLHRLGLAERFALIAPDGAGAAEPVAKEVLLFERALVCDGDGIAA